ncbi:hypothetical protein [Streptomyces antarcticus]|uniref:hypothetical protein n=1 Tax=Streptomyces antarcticus TaxID=2996458 RepID=UPI002270C306|nr:hypothetical protein [Streptomyces sp. H34-AA3]MCY0943474.1 hypothetical protein [Streptomyces sp. H34-AA3]
MELGEPMAIGGRAVPQPTCEERSAADMFLLNTLANIAAWRATEGASKAEEDAQDEVAVRLTPQEFEHVMRLLAGDGSGLSRSILEAVTDPEQERLGDVSAGEWVSQPLLTPHDVQSEPHSSPRS